VLLRAEESSAQHDLPPIHPVATVGEIVHHDRLKDGRFNIVLYGQRRARLTELPFVAPYRRARAVLIEDIANGVSDSDIGALLSTATRFAGSVRGRGSGVDLELGREQHAGKLADVCAHGLVIDARDRQKILETTDVRQRVRLVTETLAVQEALLAPSATYS
jgi:ATP-dependent Lon protease